MLTNTYECMAIILRSLRLVANCIRKPIRLIFATFWRICREYMFLHSQGYSPQCETSITIRRLIGLTQCHKNGGGLDKCLLLLKEPNDRSCITYSPTSNVANQLLYSDRMLNYRVITRSTGGVFQLGVE